MGTSMNLQAARATLCLALFAVPLLAGCLGATDEPLLPPASPSSPEPAAQPTPQQHVVTSSTTTFPTSPSPPPPTLPPSAGSSSRLSTPTPTDPCASTGESGSSEPDPSLVYDEPRFEWEYKGQVWEWEPAIPRIWWDYYANRTHPDDPKDYGVLATDPYDDALITQVACVIRDAAREAQYTEYETVEFALSFVQSLQYVSDTVGTGFDEWPKYPLETLVDEGGDCEDSSILFATLIRELGYNAVLLYFQQLNGKPNTGHMAVGLYSKPISGGTYWTSNGRDYYYVETTDSGWQIGELPDIVRGQKAHVLHLAPQAILADLTFDAPTYKDGLYEFSLTVRNIGSAPVRNLVMWGGWDAGNDRAWSPVTWDEGYQIEPDEEMSVTFWLESPPRGVWTRSLFSAWGSNAVRITAYSESFST